MDAPSRSRMHEDKDIVGGVRLHLTGHAQRVFTNTVTPQKKVADDKTQKEKKAEPVAKSERLLQYHRLRPIQEAKVAKQMPRAVGRVHLARRWGS